jgi:uncharacterized protein YjbI with pentapeptide repeats
MTNTIMVVSVCLVILAAVAIASAYWIPARFRHRRHSDAGHHEAFRSNVLQTWMLVLVVAGAIVALWQLGAAVDSLSTERSSQLWTEVNDAAKRLQDEDGSPEDYRDAIADLQLLHSKSPDHRYEIERYLRRFVREQAELGDRTAETAVADNESREPIQEALAFLLFEGQQEIEAGWQIQPDRTPLSLAGLDLRGLDLQQAQLAGADLRGSLLDEANLRNADLTGANLAGVRFRRTNLHSAMLNGSSLDGAVFEYSNLSNASLVGVDLRSTKGLSWDQLRSATLSCETSLPDPANIANDQMSGEPMMLVLRDCLLPSELHLSVKETPTVHFASTLDGPVAVTIPQLEMAITLRSKFDVKGVSVQGKTGDRFEVLGQVGLIPIPDTGIITLGSIGTGRPETSSPVTPTWVNATSSPSPWSTVTPEAAATRVPRFTPEPTIEVWMGGDLDCADFASQADAQAFFEMQGGPNVDLHGLDMNGDGIACELAP